jgi:hypothetical protein
LGSYIVCYRPSLFFIYAKKISYNEFIIFNVLFIFKKYVKINNLNNIILKIISYIVNNKQLVGMNLINRLFLYENLRNQIVPYHF